jgi:hypothetical protein
MQQHLSKVLIQKNFVLEKADIALNLFDVLKEPVLFEVAFIIQILNQG